MLGLIPQSESTPPLYYLAAWVWARAFGFGEAGLRSLSAVAGVVTIPVVYVAAERLTGARRIGLVAAALTCFSPLLVWYSQEARSYALLVLLTATALLAMSTALDGFEPRALGAWACAAVLSLATHYYAVLAIVPQAVWLLVASRRAPPGRGRGGRRGRLRARADPARARPERERQRGVDRADRTASAARAAVPPGR